MRISVVNFKSQKDVIKNIALMKDYIEKAVYSGTDFVVFPELCITGYYYFLSDPKMINEELVAQAVMYVSENILQTAYLYMFWRCHIMRLILFIMQRLLHVRIIQ